MVSVLLVHSEAADQKAFLEDLASSRNRLELRAALGFQGCLKNIFEMGMPDIIISDVSLKEEDAVSLKNHLLANGFNGRFVVMHDEAKLAQEVARVSGMHGYISRLPSPVPLLQRIVWVKEDA